MSRKRLSIFLLLFGILMMAGNSLDVFIRFAIAPLDGKTIGSGIRSLFTDHPAIISIIYFDNFLLAMRIVIGFGLILHAAWAYRLFYRYAVLLILEMIVLSLWLRFALQENPPFFPLISAICVFFFVRSDWVRGRFPEEP